MREVCCSIVSAVVFTLLYVFFIFQIGVVGATLGSIGGAAIGWSNNRRRLMEGGIIGAVYGTRLSYKLVKVTFNHLHADHDDEAQEFVFLVHVIKLIAGDLVKLLRHDDHKIMGFNKAPFGKAYNSLLDFVQSLKHPNS